MLTSPKCDLSAGYPHKQPDIWWPAASGAACWRAQGQIAKVDGFGSCGAWVPATRHLNTDSANGLFLDMWFSKDAEAFLPAPVTLGSPSDNTTPRCQKVARAGFCLSQTLNLLHWVRPDPSRRHRFIRSRESRNTVTTGPVGRGGLAGARKRLQSQQHFSDRTRFSGNPEAGSSSPLPIRWHLAPQNWPNQHSRSSRPARTARQYPMLDALYTVNFTSFNVSIIGEDNLNEIAHPKTGFQPAVLTRLSMTWPT